MSMYADVLVLISNPEVGYAIVWCTKQHSPHGEGRSEIFRIKSQMY